MAPHYGSRGGLGRFVTVTVVVAVILAVVLFVYFVQKVKSNHYFGTVLPTVSADTIK